MSLQNLDSMIACNEHHNQPVSHVDINNYSSKKLLCSKCIKYNRMMEECDLVSFDQFTECMKIIQNNFRGLNDSQFTKDDVLKVFNGISREDKIANIIKESCCLSQQYRVKMFGQIQETCEQFIKTMQEQINIFRQEIQENLKSMLSSYIQSKLNTPDQSRVAGVVVKAINDGKSYSELEEMIKQLHSGKLELKFNIEGLNSTQAQINQTLQQLLDSQKKVFESTRASLNSIIPPQSEVNNQSLINDIKQENHKGTNLLTSGDSPLKFMRLSQLKQQGNIQIINGSSSFINANLIGPMSPLKVANYNLTHQNNSNSSTFAFGNKSNFLQHQQKGNCQQRQFFKERFISSLNTLNTVCDKRINTQQNTTPRNRDNGVESLSKIPNDIDSLSEIKNYTTNNLSHINEQNDSLLQVNKSTARENSENKFNREEKRALIESLYYKNNNTNQDGLVFRPYEANKERSQLVEKNGDQKNRKQILHLNLKSINSSQSHPNLTNHNHTSSLLSLISPPKQKLIDASKSESNSPSANYTICKSEMSKQNLTCALRMNNTTLITGTQDGYLVACDISQAQNESSSILDIKFKEKIKAHKSVSHLSQCTCNHAMFFSVGQFKEDSSSIKLWNLGKNFHLTEVAELRDFHPVPIDEIIVVKEELTKDLTVQNKNVQDKQGEDQKEIESLNQLKSLVTVITLATFSKNESIKVWRITYKNGSLQNGVVLKLVDIPLKNLSIKSHLLSIENRFYVSNANKVFCYELNEDFTVITKEHHINLFSEQNDFIQHITATNNCIGVLSKQFQFIVLANDLKQKKPALNIIKQLKQINNKFDIDKIFISNLIPLQYDHFGIGYRCDKTGQKVLIINGISNKYKQTIESFDNSITFILGRNNDQKVILIEGSKVIKIQKPWVNYNKMNISFQKQS